MLLIAGNVISSAVLPFCDLVVLSTVTALGIIISDVLAVIYLGERLVWAYDAPAITLIMIGTLTIILLSNYEETTYTPETIKNLLWSTTTLAFFVSFCLLVVFTYFQYLWHKRQVIKFNNRANCWIDAKLNQLTNDADEHDRKDSIV